MARKTKLSKLDEMRNRGLQNEGFREGYEARDTLIRLGEMLQRMREASGLTQSQLAGRVGMTQPAVSRIESGLGPNGPEIETVKRYMHGCDYDLVIGARRARKRASSRQSTVRKRAADKAAPAARLSPPVPVPAALAYKTIL